MAAAATGFLKETPSLSERTAMETAEVLDLLHSSMSLPESDVSEAVFQLFLFVDDLLHEGSFGKLDDFLTQVDVSKVSEDLIVGLLTITFAGKEHLKTRADLFLRTRSVLEERGEERVDQLLRGLD
jgi:hypothetical protein